MCLGVAKGLGSRQDVASDELILQSVNSFVAHPIDGLSLVQLQQTLMGNWRLERS